MGDLVLTGLEGAVLFTGIAVLMLDLWATPEQREQFGYVAAIALGVILVGSFAVVVPEARYGFGGMYVLDEIALFFKRFFLVATALVLLLASGYSRRFRSGRSEYCALILFALVGMMFAASANDFALLFVSLELITVNFYILISYERRHARSLEAGAKYLILGALATAFLVYGIALIYGAAGTLDFRKLAVAPAVVLEDRLLLAGLLLVFAGLGFKIAAVPFQAWAPDVYEGAPAPTVAFLAVGSKAAGVVLLIRLLHTALPVLQPLWAAFLVAIAALTILYGALCAIPQRNVKRLLGYSSIANAGFIVLGLATSSVAGLGAVLYYLCGYLFAACAAFFVIAAAFDEGEAEELPGLAGLHQRSPLLAAAMAVALVSLAGVPPLAGFFGKFLLFKAAVAQAAVQPGLYALLGVALFGVVVSLYYYFKIIRAMYWPAESSVGTPIQLPQVTRWALYACMAGLLWLGILPNSLLNLAELAASSLVP